jgi:hypothetical protein
MIHPTPTTELEDLQDSILPAIAAALVTIHSIAWKTAQHFSYGARGFMRVPVSEANDLNYWLGIFNKRSKLFRRQNVTLLNQIANIKCMFW